VATKVTNGLDLLNQRVINLATPSSGTDAANKDYVDALLAGLAWKTAVRAASTANVNLTTDVDAGSVLDGVTLVQGDRILLKSQTAGATNGIYVVPAALGTATRASDTDSTAELHNATVFVREGTVNADTAWVQTSAVTTVDTTAQVWVQFGAGGGTTYTAGNGLLLSGGEFSVVAGTGITVGADTVSVTTPLLKYAATIGGATSINVDHTLGTLDVLVEVFEVATGATVICDVMRSTVNRVVLSFADAPAASSLRVVVHG
jgi:hypothetical protein